ncbi:MAG: hypothetical protein M3N18_04165 [Actinomycetota bacterium]|nr:hypothetical protein [Actinomycetota bacterium]
MTEPRPPRTPEEGSPPRRSGRFWSVTGLVCGIAAFLSMFLSIILLSAVAVLLGLLGVSFGFLGYRRGDRNLGLVAMVVSGASFVLGVLFVVVLLLLVLGLPAALFSLTGPSA